MFFKLLSFILLTVYTVIPLAATSQTKSVVSQKAEQETLTVGSLSPSTKWHWKEGQIVVNCPTRPATQQHALGLTVPKMDVVRVGFVGLGMRGPGAVERFTYIPGTHIIALCDYYAENAERCQSSLRSKGLPPATVYSGEFGY